MESHNNTFLITHDSVGYHGFEEICSYFGNGEYYEEAEDYIAKLTRSAGTVQYLNKITDLKSVFYINGNAIKIVSKKCSNPGSSDDRSYLETEASISEMPDIPKESEPFSRILSDNVFEKKLNEAIILSLADPNTTLYCIFEDDRIRDYIFARYGGFNDLCSIISRCNDSNVNIIEAVGEIPKVKASIILFKSILKDDRVAFNESIAENENNIVVDLLSKNPKIRFNLSKPTFSQTVINDWFKNNDNIKDVHLRLLKLSKEKNLDLTAVSQETLINCFCSYVLQFYHKKKEPFILSTQEKEAIYEYFKLNSISYIKI